MTSLHPWRYEASARGPRVLATLGLWWGLVLLGLLAINQFAKQVQDMGFGRHARLQGHLHGAKDGVLIMVQNQGEGINHLAITALFAQHMIL